MLDPKKVGLWSHEGGVHGTYKYSICSNTQGPNLEGYLDPHNDEDHKCIAEIYGTSEEDACRNAQVIVNALQEFYKESP